jgi:hypothetical protein
MHVRDEHRIEVREALGPQRGPAPEVEDAATEDGVRQQTDPVQLDQDGRVPDVDQSGGRAYAVPAASRLYTQSAAITSTSSAMIRIAQTGW